MKGRRYRANRGEITLALVVTDLLAVAASFAISFTLRRYAPVLSPLQHGPQVYTSAWPALFVWTLVIWREGLYPALWLTAREELRRVVTATTLASLLAVAATFVTQTGIQFSRPIVVGGWLISLVILPAARFATRVLLTRTGLTGPQAVILGAGRTARVILAGLRQQRPPALWPVALFDDDPAKMQQEIDGVPVVGALRQAASWAATRAIRTAVVAMPGVSRERLIPIVEEQSRSFQRILVIPDLFGLSGSEMDSLDIQGILALELRKNLLYRRNLIAKRAVDLALLIISLPISVPVASLMAVAVWLDGGRPVFFGQQRIGKGGRVFKAWKYRTMVRNADEVLRKALAVDPVLQAEWEASQKLRRDPRLTRVGRFLRRTSMDELPQLWNILRGEMSLVGPRPIVGEEVARYGEAFDLYGQVPPGLTGLWQVSGRSDTTYRERVWLDTHYVRNWSIWLDLVILVRTVWVVMAGIGAY